MEFNERRSSAIGVHGQQLSGRPVVARARQDDSFLLLPNTRKIRNTDFLIIPWKVLRWQAGTYYGFVNE